MINLLPYERLQKLKSLYKEKLIIVALFAAAVAMAPLILVLGATSYAEYRNTRGLESQYAKMKDLRQIQGVDNLTEDIKEINRIIGTSQASLRAAGGISKDIVRFATLRGTDIRVTGIESSDSDAVSIRGVARNREAVIAYGSALSEPKTGVCASVNVPVTTYTKKVDVPFTIICTLRHDTQ